MKLKRITYLGFTLTSMFLFSVSYAQLQPQLMNQYGQCIAPETLSKPVSQDFEVNLSSTLHNATSASTCATWLSNQGFSLGIRYYFDKFNGFISLQGRGKDSFSSEQTTALAACKKQNSNAELYFRILRHDYYQGGSFRVSDPCIAVYQFYCDPSGDPRSALYRGDCKNPPLPPPVAPIGQPPTLPTTTLPGGSGSNTCDIGPSNDISIQGSTEKVMEPIDKSVCDNLNSNYKPDGKTRYYDFKDFKTIVDTDGALETYKLSEGVTQKCPAPKAIYLVYDFRKSEPSTIASAQPTEVKCTYKFSFYCDNAGNPVTDPSYKGECPTSTSPTPNGECGDESLDKDKGEECDLGQYNSDDPNSSFGCSKDCKAVKGYKCTRTPEEFKQKEAEADALYSTLVTSHAQFDANKCGQYNAGDTEAVCYKYQEDLRKFKELNVLIKVSCTGDKEFKERLKRGQTTPVENYKVKCL